MRVLRWVFVGLYACLAIVPIAFAVGEGEVVGSLLVMFAIMIAAQAMFIFGAGTIQLCRPIRKRRLLIPVVVASLMFTLLAAGLCFSLSELFYVEKHVNEDVFLFGFVGILLASWIGWGTMIYSYAKNWQRFRVLSRVSSMLFAGSLLELLATVPSHVIVIKRPGCLVGLGTMLGIIAGLNVMFFSFGPMIVVLFLRPRYRREQAMGSQFCETCGYDLRASKDRCPECGQSFQRSGHAISLDPRQS